MINFDIAELRSKLDLAAKYVNFNVLRTALTVVKVVRDLGIVLTDPTKDGECRGKCPRCGKDRSFCLNVITNRFNCFAKGCNLKGGGVIDFYAKLYTVSAKEASHLLALVYGIQPYVKAPITENQPADNLVDGNLPVKPEREVAENSSDGSKSVPELTPQHLIASIELQLAQLKQLLTSR
jgi:hypothetical protein